VKEWRTALVTNDASVRDTIASMNDSGWQAAVVVDGGDRLLGLVTDGDIRRGLLRGVDLAAPVGEVVNRSPLTVGVDESDGATRALMRERGIHLVPVVDDDGRVRGIATLDGLPDRFDQPNPVVIMAGGVGRRLRPLTENYPKPMLQVGERPILETIVTSFAAQGFRNVYLSVNFRAEVVRDHFDDGSRFGVSITYLEEDEPLGTAGALSLLPPGIQHPIVVMNGDLITRLSVTTLLAFHANAAAAATMAVREATFDIPFGVVEVDETAITTITEKPTRRHLVNAGIYVVDPEVAASVPTGTYLDMPTLFNGLIADGRRTAAFPLHEYWIDVGRLDELERARAEWTE
jgi:dTDP-glucose pyrophosphorylase